MTADPANPPAKKPLTRFWRSIPAKKMHRVLLVWHVADPKDNTLALCGAERPIDFIECFMDPVKLYLGTSEILCKTCENHQKEPQTCEKS